MNNAGLRQTRQSHPRKGTTGNYDVARDSGALGVSGPEGGTRNERRKSDHALANAASARVCRLHKGNARTSANNVCTHRQRPGGIPGLPACAGGNRESGKEIKKFGAILRNTKRE